MQTAVEWLDEQLQDTMYIQYGYVDGVRKVIMPLEDYMKFKQEALELEKEQIIETFKYAQVLHTMNDQMRGEQYYNETYGSNGSDDHIVDTNEMVSSQTEISEKEILIEATNRYTIEDEIEAFIQGAEWMKIKLGAK